MSTPEWNQLYVNAEHDGKVGVVTISREALNWDVVNELNSAVDWLKAEGIKNVILSGDFHLSTQLVGADTTEFYPALEDENTGFNVASKWSEAARRFHNEFDVSVGFINGKRCLGGMLELMMHCHYVVAVDGAQLGMPEVTLPVVPGMEGCHWSLRKAGTNMPKVLELLMTGRPVRAKNASGWLIDYAGSLDDAIQKTWLIASGGNHGLTERKLVEGALALPSDVKVPAAANQFMADGRKAIMDCVKASCGVPVSQALEIQAKHSAGFMLTKACQKGAIGSTFKKVMKL